MTNNLQFPKDFLWGAAISAHQTEGNNTNTDWWVFENNTDPKKFNGKTAKDVSGRACDFYNRYKEDFELCVNMNAKAIRLSVEWARIEPQEGQFDEKALNHYKIMLQTAKDLGLKTYVTLHHFTNPIWFSELNGWENSKSPEYFTKYVHKTVEALDEQIDGYMTINEPDVYSYCSYIEGKWPPCKQNSMLALKVKWFLGLAHINAYRAIKKLSHKPVGIVHNQSYYLPGSNSVFDKLGAKLADFIFNDLAIYQMRGNYDFIGLNHYFTHVVKNFKRSSPEGDFSDLGWVIYPEGIYKVLLGLKKFNKPIIITENGLADAGDTKRRMFIKNMLANVHKAISENVNVTGYFYWSLMDNLEWADGYSAKFGLVEIDRQNKLQRKIRESYTYYSQICKTGIIDM